MAKLWVGLLFLLLVPISALVYLSWGPMDIPWTSLWSLMGEESPTAYVIWHLRFPRMLMALVAGFGLGLAGAAMQGLFRNPLVSPGLVGVSAGSALFTVLAIVLGGSFLATLPEWFGDLGLSMVSFFGAVFTMFVVYALARWIGGGTILTLILAGLAISAFAEAWIGLMRFLADDAQLRDMTFWQLGSLGGANATRVALAFGICVLAACLLFPSARALNAMALGEEDAGFLGISVRKTERMVLIGAALAVGASVAFCGVIAFIGLMVPHLVRLLIGPDHRILLPASGLAGGLLLLWSDGLARNLAAPAEIPVSVITATLGAPFIIWLMIRQGKKQKL